MTTTTDSATDRDTAGTVQEFFTRFAAGDRPGLVALFAEGADFAVAGSPTVSWTGQRRSTTEIDEFFRICTEDITTQKFDIDRTLVDGDQAVVVGEFAHLVHATDKVFDSSFTLRITVTGGLISGYRMLEDSFGAAEAFIP